MALPDASLGIPANFDADQFRAAIKFAMQMGAPNEPLRQISFIRKVGGTRYYMPDGTEVFPQEGDIKVDRDGKPLNPDIAMVDEEDVEITADCAVDLKPVHDVGELPVGKFRPVKAEVTVLDVDYVKIAACREMKYNGDRYIYGYEPTDNGLFDVDIHTMIFYALDES